MEENILNQELIANRLIEEEEFHHLNNPADGIKPVIKKYLGVPNHVDQIDNKFYFNDGDAKVEVVVVTNEIIRVRLAPHSVFLDDFSYAVPKLEHKAIVFCLYEDESEFRVSTSVVNCHIRKKDFFISFSDSQNHVTSTDAVPMFIAPKPAVTKKAFLDLGISPRNLTLGAKG
jgi:alpha-glucosidase